MADQNLENDELIELEFDEESVAYYIDDEFGNEIGVCLIENGEEVEYMYDEDDVEDATAQQKQGAHVKPTQQQPSLNSNFEISPELKENLQKTKEELGDVKEDTAEIAKELAQAAKELNEAYDEILDSFKIFKHKK